MSKRNKPTGTKRCRACRCPLIVFGGDAARVRCALRIEIDRLPQLDRSYRVNLQKPSET